MTTIAQVLLAVARELAETARKEVEQELGGGKTLTEWYEKGIYFRESQTESGRYIASYDFKERKCRLSAAMQAVSA